MNEPVITEDLTRMVREVPPAAARPERYHIRERLNKLKDDPGEWYRIHVGKGAPNLVYGHLRKLAGDGWKDYFEIRTSGVLKDGTVLAEGHKAVWARWIHQPGQNGSQAD